MFKRGLLIAMIIAGVFQMSACNKGEDGASQTGSSQSGVASSKTNVSEAASRAVSAISAVPAEDYKDYEKVPVSVQGREGTIILPKTKKGKGWIWRTELFGVADYADKEMLKRGYALAYYKISDLYGSDEAVTLMKAFADKMVEMGYGAKPVLFGFREGALSAVNFAASYPQRVSGLYLDAPVLDIKSWPAGFGASDGAAKDWENCKKQYGLANDQAAKAFNKNPLDKAKALAKTGLPIFIVAGELDKVVPYKENTLLFEQSYREEGGCIRVTIKKGAGHTPYSLENPNELCSFLEECLAGTRIEDIKMTAFSDLHLSYTPDRFGHGSDVMGPMQRFDVILSEAKAFGSQILVNGGDFGCKFDGSAYEKQALDKWNAFEGSKIATLGNHEYDVKGNEESYKKSMGMPANYYYYDYSPSLRFVVLDSSNPSQLPTEAQYIWMDQVVASAKGNCIILIHGAPWRPIDTKTRTQIKKHNTDPNNPKILMLMHGHTHMTSYMIADGGTHYLELNSPTYRYDPKFDPPAVFYKTVPFAQITISTKNQVTVKGHGEKNAWVDEKHPNDDMTYQESVPKILS